MDLIELSFALADIRDRVESALKTADGVAQDIGVLEEVRGHLKEALRCLEEYDILEGA